MTQQLFNTRAVLDLLRPDRTGADRFLGQSHFMGSRNVFGGQVLGQALYAAASTVTDRQPHSLHAMFILPGNYNLPIEYEVERVRDGGSFSTRRVVAFQEGRRIFVMSASFQREENGLSHQKPAPVAPDPDALAPNVETLAARAQAAGRLYHPVPVDFRSDPVDDPYAPQARDAQRLLWARAPVALPDDVLAHQALFAYVSDYGLLWTALLPHAVAIDDPRLQMASLDHAIWFHRPFRMDEWLLFAMESPNASGGRGLSCAHVYNRSGELVATLAQEGLVRLREPQKKGM